MYGRPEAYVLTSGYIVSDVLGSRICLKGLVNLRSRCERKAGGEPQVNAARIAARENARQLATYFSFRPQARGS